MTPQIAQGANLAFEDGLELALQLSSASDKVFFHYCMWEDRWLYFLNTVLFVTLSMNRVHPRQIADVLPTSVTVIERACV
jgi:2-polyprenyl-6-methoxyphenol hydroxylase-like FAD-dependent oxidoreductase